MRTRGTVARRACAWAGLTVLLLAGPSGAGGMILWSDNFEDGNANCWTITNNGATVAVTSATANGGSYSLGVTGASGGGQGALAYSRIVYTDFTEEYTVQFAFRYSDFHWDRFLIFGHIRLLLDYPGLPLKCDPVGNNSFIGNSVSGSSFESYLPADEWGWFTVHCRPGDQEYDVFVNGTPMGTVSYQGTVVPGNQLWFEDNHSSANFLDAW